MIYLLRNRKNGVFYGQRCFSSIAGALDHLENKFKKNKENWEVLYLEVKGKTRPKKAKIKITKKLYEALNKSIADWRRRAKGEVVPTKCPLCVEDSLDCKQCPIARYTGISGCRETPYTAWEKSPALYASSERTQLAKDMVLFLYEVKDNCEVGE